VRIYREGQTKFQNTIASYFKKGCEWIELEPENYQLSSKAYMSDQDKKQEVTKADAEVRLALETDPIGEDDSVYIKACKAKFKRDMEMYRKIEQLKYTTAPQQ
jgi:hypothetical protein